MIEDDLTICDVVEIVLADAGYDFSSVGDTLSALRVLELRQADAILLDLTLPGESTEAFVSTYRSLPNGTAPILLVSGRADIEQRVASLGADGWLAKPFDIDALVDTVQALLANRRAYRTDRASTCGERESAGRAHERDQRCLI